MKTEIKDSSSKLWSEPHSDKIQSFYKVATIDTEQYMAKIDWGAMIQPQDHILELGCGRGLWIQKLISNGWVKKTNHYQAVDASAAVLIGLKKTIQNDITVGEMIQADFLEMNIPRADFIIAANSLQTIPTIDLMKVINKLLCSAKKTLMIVSFSREGFYEKFSSVAREQDNVYTCAEDIQSKLDQNNNAYTTIEQHYTHDWAVNATQLPLYLSHCALLESIQLDKYRDFLKQYLSGERYAFRQRQLITTISLG